MKFLDEFLDTLKHYREFKRAMANGHFERDENGDILLPKQQLWVRGRYTHEAPDGLGLITDPNLLTTEGMTHIWDALVANGTRYHPWYVGIGSGTSSPAAGWDASNWASNATELTSQYSEPTRVEYDEGTPATSAVDNSANKATFTAATTSVSIWQAALLTLSTKGGTTGVLLSASKFSAVRTLPAVSDALNIQITLSATSSP